MFIELKYTTVIGADAFKHAITIKQSVIKHGYFRVALAVILAVNKDFHAKRIKLRDKMNRSKREFPRDKLRAADIFRPLCDPMV